MLPKDLKFERSFRTFYFFGAIFKDVLGSVSPESKKSFGEKDVSEKKILRKKMFRSKDVSEKDPSGLTSFGKRSFGVNIL